MGNEESKNKISPTEDLLREHGLLNRMLLIYDDFITHPDNGKIPYIKRIASIIQLFIENYHEKMEENYVFPIVLEYVKHTNKPNISDIEILINELLYQHEHGRKLTNTIISSNDINIILTSIKMFVFMYRAHETREDTEIFELFRKSISKERMDELGDIFEEIEHNVLGKGGFKSILSEVKEIEIDLGLDSLASYVIK